MASAFQQEAGPAGQVPCLPRARLGHHSGSRWPTLPTAQALSGWVCPLLPRLRPGLAKHGQGPPSTTLHCQPPVPASPGLGWRPGLPTPGHGWEAAALRPPSPSSQGPGTAPSCHALPPWPPQPPATSWTHKGTSSVHTEHAGPPGACDRRLCLSPPLGSRDPVLSRRPHPCSGPLLGAGCRGPRCCALILHLGTAHSPWCSGGSAPEAWPLHGHPDGQGSAQPRWARGRAAGSRAPGSPAGAGTSVLL